MWERLGGGWENSYKATNKCSEARQKRPRSTPVFERKEAEENFFGSVFRKMLFFLNPQSSREFSPGIQK